MFIFFAANIPGLVVRLACFTNSKRPVPFWILESYGLVESFRCEEQRTLFLHGIRYKDQEQVTNKEILFDIITR